MTDYDCDGLELDFGMGGVVPAGTGEQLAPMLTEWVASISAMTRANGGILGVRIYPTLAGNAEMGLDVMEWVERGLVDYLMPYQYGYFELDSQMPIGWAIDACRDTDISVYGYCCGNPEGLTPTEPNRPLGNAIEGRGGAFSESAAM